MTCRAVHIPPSAASRGWTSGRHLTTTPICQTSVRQTTRGFDMCLLPSTNGARISSPAYILFGAISGYERYRERVRR